MAIFFLCLFAFHSPVSLSTSRLSLFVRKPTALGLGSTLLTPFKLNYLTKDCVSNKVTLRGTWGLDLQHINLRETHNQTHKRLKLSETFKTDGEGNGNPLQDSCLENSRDRGAWRATVHGLQRIRHD